MNNPTTSQIVLAIQSGSFDADLDNILDAVNLRLGTIIPNITLTPVTTLPATKKELQIWDFKVGMQAWCNERIRPRYCKGAQVTVTKVNRERVMIKFNDVEDAGRFGSAEVSCPIRLLSLTKVSR